LFIFPLVNTAIASDDNMMGGAGGESAVDMPPPQDAPATTEGITTGGEGEPIDDGDDGDDGVDDFDAIQAKAGIDTGTDSAASAAAQGQDQNCPPTTTAGSSDVGSAAANILPNSFSEMATGQNLMHQVQLDDLGDLFGLPQSNCPPREATSSPTMRAFTPDIPPKSWEDIKISTKKNDDGSKTDIYKSVGGKEGDTTEVTVLLDGTIKYLHKSKDQIPTYSSAYSPVTRLLLSQISKEESQF